MLRDSVTSPSDKLYLRYGQESDAVPHKNFLVSNAVEYEILTACVNKILCRSYFPYFDQQNGSIFYSISSTKYIA